MLSVEPDRRGFAAGARWQVAVFADPLRLGPLRFPQVGRPAGPSARQTLVIVAIEPFERWEWNLDPAPLRARRADGDPIGRGPAARGRGRPDGGDGRPCSTARAPTLASPEPPSTGSTTSSRPRPAL